MSRKPVNKSTSSTIKDFAWGLFKSYLTVLFIGVILLVGFGMIFSTTIWGQAVTTLCGLVLYFSFFYSHAWAVGERDRNLVLHEHIQYDDLKGLKAGLYSMIPFFVLTCIEIVRGYTGLFEEAYLFVYNLLTSPFILFTTFFQKHNLHFLQPLLCLIPPVFSWIGFRHGYALKEPLLRFLYVSSNKTKKNYRSRDGKKTTNAPTANQVVTAATVQRPGGNPADEANKRKKLPTRKTDGDRKLRSR